jgi:hypothetical protein
VHTGCGYISPWVTGLQTPLLESAIAHVLSKLISNTFDILGNMELFPLPDVSTPLCEKCKSFDWAILHKKYPYDRRLDQYGHIHLDIKSAVESASMGCKLCALILDVLPARKTYHKIYVGASDHPKGHFQKLTTVCYCTSKRDHYVMRSLHVCIYDGKNETFRCGLKL